jgi:hypothetical protein
VLVMTDTHGQRQLCRGADDPKPGSPPLFGPVAHYRTAGSLPAEPVLPLKSIPRAVTTEVSKDFPTGQLGSMIDVVPPWDHPAGLVVRQSFCPGPISDHLVLNPHLGSRECVENGYREPIRDIGAVIGVDHDVRCGPGSGLGTGSST